MNNTLFSNIQGLLDIKQYGPSTLDNRTIIRSKQSLPPEFLKGCGWSDWEIESAKLLNPKLTQSQITDVVYEIDRLRNSSPIQMHSLFISYSHDDSRFIDFIGDHFDTKHIRYWRDIHHGTAGPLEKQVERAISLNRTVLLVLSKHSIESDWVEWEVEKARELQKKLGRDVLCPVALDDSWQSASWEGRLMNQIKKYNILDFSNWENADNFDQQFSKLLKGLNIFYRDQEG